jgi:hypothetical protein
MRTSYKQKSNRKRYNKKSRRLNKHTKGGGWRNKRTKNKQSKKSPDPDPDPFSEKSTTSSLPLAQMKEDYKAKFDDYFNKMETIHYLTLKNYKTVKEDATDAEKLLHEIYNISSDSFGDSTEIDEINNELNGFGE